ncbi:TetR/AcrR family transcriptional regulator [Geodermatophilus sabuli]|uniref:Transcriptional regulator, TetR family n=1 Tax=Geodermatophilus sabuli TaxID=1564158 RepID=A0A285EB21_9ACTN|nr:TetR family transcriptional regulator C-terminal domain-containing protein [Geodermatophilus sabuli]MBB3081866.1 AcrR family transcriptional regulator [Geodermatophilus sabuli]SNX95261.1 transcriptional regulator, TetR family [Geodermatophilus sabuli]
MPRRADHEQRRAELTAALLRIASTRGLQAVTMREVAHEAGASLRVVQYYFADKATLLTAGLAELAGRLDRRVRGRAAAGTGLTVREAFEVVLGSILPTDDDSRADALAWAAYYAVALTDPALGAGGRNHPDALEAYLTARLERAQGEGDAPRELDARTEVVLLLALANGLTASVLGRQRGAGDALHVLRHQLDRVLGPPAS